jgi:carbon storage regulator CsrA
VLILSRLVNEEVIVGDVRLKVIDVGNGRVRIGFTGPRDVLICRGEVLEDRQIITMDDYVEKHRRKAG